MRLKHFLMAALRRVAYIIGYLLPIKKNRIVVSSYYGKGYGDNPKYIVNELLKRYKKYKIVWLINSIDNAALLPKEVIACENSSLRAIIYISTAKIWIDNCRKNFPHKKKRQFYIQTWHGDCGFKKCEKDAEDHLDKMYVKMAKRDSQNIDLFVSGTRWFTSLIRSSFWYTGEIAEIGYPRRDALVNTTKDQIEVIKRKLNLSESDRVLLYAPTFRVIKEGQLFSSSCYELHWQRVLTALSERFGGHWVGLSRMHPNFSRYAGELNLPLGVVDVTYYDDLQELMLISDCMISDYSSCLAEYAITKKPGFVFALDYKDYKDDRDVYFELDTLPFPFAQNNCELINQILDFNDDEFSQKLRYFCEKTFGFVDGGCSAVTIANIIEAQCS